MGFWFGTAKEIEKYVENRNDCENCKYHEVYGDFSGDGCHCNNENVSEMQHYKNCYYFMYPRIKGLENKNCTYFERCL